MQEGHGGENEPPDQPDGWSLLPGQEDEPTGEGDPPGSSWAPSPAAPPLPASQPGHGQPGYGQPSYGQPSYRQPSYGQPGHQAPPASPGAPPSQYDTWTIASGDQGGWAPPPSGGPRDWSPPQGGWGPPPGGGYGQPGGGGYGHPGGGYGQPGGPPRRRGNHPLIYLLVAVLAAALGAGAVFAFQSRSQSAASLGPQGLSGPPANPGGGSQGSTSTSGINVQSVADKVEPGVVDVTSSLRYTGQVFEGTGMVLTSSGLVLTNNHVVEGSTKVTVTLVATGRRYNAQIVGTDSVDDVALLRLVGASGLQTVRTGDSSKITLGTPVVAMGNAGGAGGKPTVTSGTITALGRTITATDSGSGTSETLHNMFQTNAPIAEGDSGGPLSNAAGEVIGMDTAANTQTFGGSGTSQGFAIPIDRALGIVRQISAGHGSAAIRIGQPAFMGIAVAGTSANASSADTPQQQLQQLQQTAQGSGGGTNSNGGCLSNDDVSPVPASIAPAGSGTLIAGVFCGQPASAAGLVGGDVILSINGQTVGPPSSLTGLLAQYRPGERISVTWENPGGHQQTGSLTLAPGPAK